MLKRSLKYLFLLLFFIISCLIIYNTNQKEVKTNNVNKQYKVIKKINNKKEVIEDIQNINDSSIGKLIIDKININSKLYDIDSEYNNVDKNITILKGSIEPSNPESIMFIAAHSGNGLFAYFRNLNKLNKEDKITLIYKNKTYYYQVLESYEIEKDGTLEITKLPQKQLVLTTCSPNNKSKQLIINCTIKES